MRKCIFPSSICLFVLSWIVLSNAANFNPTCYSYDVLPAVTDTSVSDYSGGHVFSFGSIVPGLDATDYVWANGSGAAALQLSWASGGVALLQGSIVPVLAGGVLGSLSQAWTINLKFATVLDSSVTPHQELHPNAYVPSGSINPSTWVFFVLTSGVMNGPGGLQFSLSQSSATMAFQLGVGANGKNLNFGASSWFGLTDAATGQSYGQVDLNIDLACAPPVLDQCDTDVYQVVPAMADESVSGHFGGHVFAFNTTVNGYLESSNYVFLANSGRIQFLLGGAYLTGSIVPLYPDNTVGDQSHAWSVSFILLNQPYNSSIDAKLELGWIAYVPSGPVNPWTWSYYSIISAVLVGPSGSGKQLDLVYYSSSMPLQVGIGANGKNINLGASAWFLFQDHVTKRVLGLVDLNVDFICLPPSISSDCTNGTYTALTANADATLGGLYGGHVLAFNTTAGGLLSSTSYVFSGSSGLFKLTPTGAILTGLLVPLLSGGAVGSISTAWHLAVTFQAIPFDVTLMPKLELSTSAYYPTGRIQTWTWSFFRATSAVLIGPSSQQIDLIELFANMPLQIGVGANGKNLHFGASAWYNFINHTTRLTYGIVDVNIDLNCITSTAHRSVDLDEPVCIDGVCG